MEIDTSHGASTVTNVSSGIPDSVQEKKDSRMWQKFFMHMKNSVLIQPWLDHISVKLAARAGVVTHCTRYFHLAEFSGSSQGLGAHPDCR